MPIYSDSQLNTYKQCPLKYRLRYLERIKRKKEGIEAFMGSMVHETLKKCYDDIRFIKRNSLADLLDFYNKSWQQNWNDSIIIVKPELTQENYRTLGEKLIESYYKHYFPFDTDITIETEMRVGFSLDKDNKYRMQGYIDRLSRTPDGTYEIHDYKTSANLPGQEDVDNDRQLGLYQIGVQKKWPDVETIRLIWHYLAFNRELISYRTPEAIYSLIGTTKSLIDAIESVQDFPPHESRLCEWCEYPDLCPRRRHLFTLETLPANKYLNEPGVMLANRYAYLKDEETQIESEINKVREAILDFAQKEKIEVMNGSNCRLTITSDEKLKFPAKKDGQRRELDEIIKKEGKWEEASELDTTVLKHIIESDLWSKDLIEKVVKYGKIEKSSSIRILKLKNES